MSKYEEHFRVEDINKILTVINYLESCVFLCLPSVGKRKFSKYLVYDDEIGEKYFPDFRRMYFDCRLPPDDFEIQIDSIREVVEKEKAHVLLVLDSIDNIFKNVNLLERLEYLNNHYDDKVHLVTFLSAVRYYLDNQHNSFLSRYNFLSRNILYLSPLKASDFRVVIKTYLDQYDLKLDDKKIDELFFLSGGNNSYLKNILRSIKIGILNPNDLYNPRKIFSTVLSFKFLGDEILFKLGDESTKLLLTDSYYSDPVLLNLGIVNNQGELFSPLFRLFLDSKKLVSANPSFEKIFTDQELGVVNSLLVHKGSILTRDDIAKILWKSEYLKNYSDWAIDKVIEKVRRKIKENKIGYKLVTKRGVGFFIE